MDPLPTAIVTESSADSPLDSSIGALLVAEAVAMTTSLQAATAGLDSDEDDADSTSSESSDDDIDSQMLFRAADPARILVRPGSPENRRSDTTGLVRAAAAGHQYHDFGDPPSMATELAMAPSYSVDWLAGLSGDVDTPPLDGCPPARRVVPAPESAPEACAGPARVAAAPRAPAPPQPRLPRWGAVCEMDLLGSIGPSGASTAGALVYEGYDSYDSSSSDSDMSSTGMSTSIDGSIDSFSSCDYDLGSSHFTEISEEQAEFANAGAVPQMCVAGAEVTRSRTPERKRTRRVVQVFPAHTTEAAITPCPFCKSNRTDAPFRQFCSKLGYASDGPAFCRCCSATFQRHRRLEARSADRPVDRPNMCSLGQPCTTCSGVVSHCVITTLQAAMRRLNPPAPAAADKRKAAAPPPAAEFSGKQMTGKRMKVSLPGLTGVLVVTLGASDTYHAHASIHTQTQRLLEMLCGGTPCFAHPALRNAQRSSHSTLACPCFPRFPTRPTRTGAPKPGLQGPTATATARRISSKPARAAATSAPSARPSGTYQSTGEACPLLIRIRHTDTAYRYGHAGRLRTGSVSARRSMPGA